MSFLRTLIVCNEENEVAHWKTIVKQLALLPHYTSAPQLLTSPSVAAKYDIVIVDTSNLQTNISLCQKLRRLCDGAMLMFVYGVNDAHLVAGYNAGADECIDKEIGDRLLQAKVNSWSKRIKVFRNTSEGATGNGMSTPNGHD
jgi:DNA-binding response OmpR family regulator